MTGDLVREYVELVSEFTDADKSLIEGSFLFAISTVVGKRKFIVYPPKIRPFSGNIIGKLYLNIFLALFGKTRISRKSTIIGIAEDLIRVIMREEYDHNPLISETWTTEALVTDILPQKENRKEGYVHACWICDEVARFFEANKKKNYMGEAQGFLQRLYDCETISRSTRQSGLVEIKEPYFTSLIASTPYLFRERLVTESDFHHGLMNRYILLTDLHKRKTRPISFQKIVDDRKFTELKNELIKRIKPKPDEPPMGLNEGAQRLYADYSQQIDRKVMNEEVDETEGAYLSGLDLNLLKIAGLYAVADDRPIIKETDVKRAIEFMEKSVESFRELIKETQFYESRYRKKLADTSAIYDKIYQLIEANGGYITTGTLLERLGMVKNEAKPLILSMIEMGKITAVRSKNNRGRLLIYLFNNSREAEEFVKENQDNDAIILSESVLETVW